MGSNLANRGGFNRADLRRLTWTIESKCVLTWLTGLDGDLRKLTWTTEGEWVLTWLTGLAGYLRKLRWTI